MPVYRVINRYRSRETGDRVQPGTLVTLSAPVGERMTRRGLVAPVERQAQPETATRVPAENAARRTAPVHTGGGWYELPNGERVRGKDAAYQRMTEF